MNRKDRFGRETMPSATNSENESSAYAAANLSDSSRKPHKAGIGALLALVLLPVPAPLSRVIERRLCREHYVVADPSVIDEDGNVEERLCKIDGVQKGLAWIQGTMETAWIVGGEHGLTLAGMRIATHSLQILS
ncbi:major facilitator superfamily transporter [Colletotrichum tofieldiae]|nr:major facilitator superfamily transporter [Colletotrichum tofieldiae]